VVHSGTIGCHPLIAIPERIRLVGKFWAIKRHVAFLAIAETLFNIIGSTLFHRSIVGWILVWCLVTLLLLRTLDIVLLLGILRTLATTLLRIRRALLVLTSIPLVRRPLVS
jgi:hypothetical protein